MCVFGQCGPGLNGCACRTQPGWVPSPVNSPSSLSNYLPGTLALVAFPPAYYPDETSPILFRARLCVVKVQQMERVLGGLQVFRVVLLLHVGFGGILAAVGGLGH